MSDPDTDRLRRLRADAVQLTLRELDRYGRRIRRGRLRTPRAAVIVEIHTLEKFRTADEARITERVETYRSTAAWLRSVSVRFLVAEQRVAKQAVAVRVLPDEDDEAAPEESDRFLARQLILTQGALRAQVLLVVDDRPRPLMRRGDHDHDTVDPFDDVLLPDQFDDVPRGRLLEVVRRDGQDGVAVLRGADRPEVVVAADGMDLVRGAMPHPLRTSGAITFRPDGTNAAYVLEYELVEPDFHRLFSGTSSADPTPMSLDMVARGREVRLLVDPPPLDTPIRFKEFPVAMPGLGDTMDVEILYTEAETDGEPEQRWHVKLYACPTPQHALRLRRYLRDQSRIVPKVNSAARALGAAGRPMAPVYVAPPLTETRLTRETATRRADVDPAVFAEAERLAIWFGSPDVPQPDSYVVVVSPLLEPVWWAATSESPHLDALADLRPIAQAVRACHEQKVLHGDVTPQNVCSDDDGLVLVDGDAITPLDKGRLVRRTAYYTSRAVLDQLEGRVVAAPQRPAFDFREHDRFGFAVLALTALAGTGPTNALLTPYGRSRDIDDPDLVASELQDQWSDERWPELINRLAEPFRPEVLQQAWDPVQWLDELVRAAEADQARALARNVGPVVVTLLERRLLEEDRRAERLLRLWGLIALATGAVVLAAAIMGW